MPPVIAAAVNCIVIRKSLSRTVLSLLRSEQKASHASRISRIDLGRLSFLPRFQLRQLLRELRSAFAVLGGMFICLLVLYLMIKVMIDRASYSISLLKVFGYCTGEVRRLYLDGNFVVVALGALVCIPAAKGLMDVIYPYFVSNVAAGLELSFPPQLYAVIYAGVLACYLLIDLVLVRRLDRMTPAEVLKNRE